MVIISEKIKSIPSLRPLISLSGGIIACFENLFTGGNNIMMMILLFGLAVILLSRIISISVKLDRISDFLLLPAFFAAGFLLAYSSGIDISYPGDGYFLADVVSLPVEKKRSVKYTLKLKGEINAAKEISYTFLFNAYFPVSSKKDLPEHGDVLLIKTSLKPISNQGNPKEFDYAGYLKRKKIYASCYLEDQNWKKIDSVETFSSLSMVALELKNRLQQMIINTACNTGNSGHDVLLAICTGDKSMLDKEIKEIYADAGAIHVMAVSGLHVGVIWLFISNLTLFLSRKKSLRILQFFIITGILWAFAILTGLSASATRACTMFTLASFSRLVNHRSSIFNGVFVAAMIQLSIDPLRLYDTGFQFSYSAVISILLFQPPLKSLCKSKNFIISKLSDLITVSVAAQVLTFPLAIFYFHQFPVYFLLTNICIIPMVTLLMTFFLGSILFLFIPVLSESLLIVSLKISEIMTYCNTFINSLPMTIIDNIHINVIQLFLLIFIPLAFIAFFHLKRYYYLVTNIILVAFLFHSEIYKNRDKDNDQLCVFNIQDCSAIDIHYGNDHFLLNNGNCSIFQKLEYAARGYWLEYFSNDPELVCIDDLEDSVYMKYFFRLPGKRNYLILTGKKSVVIINDTDLFHDYIPKKKIFINALILSNKAKIQIEAIATFFDFENLIMDSSVPTYIPDPVNPDTLEINYHRITDRGAFILEL